MKEGELGLYPNFPKRWFPFETLIIPYQSRVAWHKLLLFKGIVEVCTGLIPDSNRVVVALKTTS